MHKLREPRLIDPPALADHKDHHYRNTAASRQLPRLSSAQVLASPCTGKNAACIIRRGIVMVGIYVSVGRWELCSCG